MYVGVGVSLSNPSTPRYVGGSNDRNKIALNSAASMLRRRMKCPVARFRVLAAFFLVSFFPLLDLLKRRSPSILWIMPDHREKTQSRKLFTESPCFGDRRSLPVCGGQISAADDNSKRYLFAGVSRKIETDRARKGTRRSTSV